jgi:hypothetical protein
MSERKTFLEKDQAWALLGLVAAAAIGIFANVLAARHYTRWDWTKHQLYTLTPATKETLHGLRDPVELWVLLGRGDPMEQSIKQLMQSYAAETSQLDVHYIDPDANALALDEVKKRFHIQTARTDDGRLIADTIVVAAHGDRHWFLTPSDMVEVVSGSGAEEQRVKPREEQAITSAIRHVTAGEKTRLCFVTGHGERSIQDGSDEGLGLLRDLLEKDNYETAEVDTTPQNAVDPYKGCSVAIIAPPSVRMGELGAMSDAEASRLRTWLLGGGSLFVATGAEVVEATIKPLRKVLEPFGIGLDQRLVLDPDPAMVVPDTHAINFVVSAKDHAVTAPLVVSDAVKSPPHVVLDTVRPLKRLDATGGATVSDLLVTTRSSFSVDFERTRSILGTSPSETPPMQPGDVAGPFPIALASELPKKDAKAPHGPRVVVVGSTYVVSQINWRAPGPWRGGAFLVENAIAWLGSTPPILDVPARPTIAAGLKLSQDDKDAFRNYVLIYMPLAVAIVGASVALRRRRTEARGAEGRAKPTPKPKKSKPRGRE